MSSTCHLRTTPTRSSPSKPVSVEVALQWNSLERKTDENERAHSFATRHLHRRRGTHVEGLKAALTSVLNRYAFECGQSSRTRKSRSTQGIWEGLTAAVSVKLR